MKLSGIGDPNNPDATAYTVPATKRLAPNPDNAKLRTERSIEKLREILPPGSTVYSIQRQSTNLFRRYTLYAFVWDDAKKQPRPWWITGLVATATGCTYYDKTETVSLRNTGGGHPVPDLLEILSRALHTDKPAKPYKAGQTLEHSEL